MLDGKKYGELKKEERAKWKELTPKQKWGYFVDYYLWKTIVGIALLGACVSLIMQIFILRDEPVYTGCILNFNLTEEGKEFLTTGYYDYLGGGKKKYLPKTVSCFIEFKDTEQVLDAGNETMVLFAQFATKDYDYVLLTDYSLEAMEPLDVYADLSEVLSGEWSEILAGRIRTAKTDRQEEPMPALIELSGTGFAQMLGFSGEDKLYLAFAVNTADGEKINPFLDYILYDLKEKKDAGI